MKQSTKKYFERVGSAFSILFNVVLGGNEHQSFSARNWELKRCNKKNCVKIIDAFFFFDKDHCMKCWVYWIVRSNR